MNIAIEAIVNFFVSQGMPKWCLHYTLAQLCYVKKKKSFQTSIKEYFIAKKAPPSSDNADLLQTFNLLKKKVICKAQ